MRKNIILPTNNSRVRTKRGVASLYIVIFTTLLLGIITLSFMRIILSEASQTSNNDLSQSAYDSALAGIEDAKIALLKYHDCISQGYTAGTEASCEQVIYEMQYGIANDSCDTVAKVLGRTLESEDPSNSGGEVNTEGVIIQETQDSTQAGNASTMLQAYTCVKIAEELPDYRTTLNSESRVRIIPLRSDSISEVKSVRVSWFSDINRANSGTVFGVSELGNSTHRYAPPMISVQLLQTDQIFGYSELSATRAAGGANTDRATLYLTPKAGDDNNGKANFFSAVEFAATNDKAPNTTVVLDEANNVTKNYQQGPHDVVCPESTDRIFNCIATIELPNTFNGRERNRGASFLVVTLPYGQPTTDLSVELCTETQCYDDDSNLATAVFTGVQAKIDSTGRANDLYRRLEARVELVDVYFPYPEFAIELNGDGDGNIDKSFWVTYNCWSSRDGAKEGCVNNRFDTSLSSFN